MLKISRMGDYAIVLLTAMSQACSARPDGQCNARMLADETGLGQPTVGKFLKVLAAARLLNSQQGRRGGYHLARAPERITLAEIIEAVDGPIAMTDCFRDDHECGMEDNCTIRPHWKLINASVRQLLDATTLADLITPINQDQVPVWYSARPDATGNVHAADRRLERKTS
jgi:FeS assembly SUF system regulator